MYSTSSGIPGAAGSAPLDIFRGELKEGTITFHDRTAARCKSSLIVPIHGAPVAIRTASHSAHNVSGALATASHPHTRTLTFDPSPVGREGGNATDARYCGASRLMTPFARRAYRRCTDLCQEEHQP